MVMVKRKSSTSTSIQLFLACSINLLTLWWGKVLPICLPNYPLESSKSVWSCHLWYNEFHWMAMVDSCYLKYLFFSFLKQQYKIKFCLTEHLLLKLFCKITLKTFFNSFNCMEKNLFDKIDFKTCFNSFNIIFRNTTKTQSNTVSFFLFNYLF